MAILNTILFTLIQVDTTKLAVKLGDVIEPKPVEFTFQTIGWKILFLVVSLTNLILFAFWIKRFVKNKYKREAIKKINQITLTENPVKEIFTNLKIVTIKTFGREKVANLSGSEWLDFLSKTAKNTDFNKYQDIVNKAIYKDEGIDKEYLYSLKSISIKWIKTHNDRNAKHTR